MTPHDTKNHLPDALRDSKLPWLPDETSQAACPRCGDGWKARLGELQFELSIGDPSQLPDDHPKPPHTLQMRLVDTYLDLEKGSWTPPSLEIAVQVAESLHQLLHQLLLQQVLDATHTS